MYKDNWIRIKTNVDLCIYLLRMIWYDMMLYDMMWQTLSCVIKHAWYDMIWCYMIWYDVIWSPKLKRQSAAIERVQRRATKLLYEIREWSYERRLKFLNLPSLKYRRYRGDLIQTYKIIHKIDDLKTEDFFTIRNDTNTRSMNVNFYIENCSSNSKLHSFSYRSRRYWNSLSKLTKEARDRNSFKNLLDKDPNRFISYYEYDNWISRQNYHKYQKLKNVWDGASKG